MKDEQQREKQQLKEKYIKDIVNTLTEAELDVVRGIAHYIHHRI